MNAPDVSRLFERESDEPEFPARSQWHAIHDHRPDRLSSRQFIQIYLQSRCERARKTDAASLRIDYESLATLGELRRWIKTRDPHRKLRANAGAAAGGFVGCCSGLHALLQNSTSEGQEFPPRRARKEHEGNHEIPERDDQRLDGHHGTDLDEWTGSG